MARWILLLSDYEWSICHRPGKKHTNADALSRHQPPSVNMASHHATLDESFEEVMAPVVGAVQDVLGAVGMTPTWSYRELRDMQATDPIISRLLAQFTERPSAAGRWRSHPKLIAYRKIWHQLALDAGILYRFCPATTVDGGEDKQLLVLPTCLIAPVLDQLHDNADHFGDDRTIGRVSDTCWWPGYSKDIYEYIQSCEMCSRREPMSKTKGMLQNVPVRGLMEMIGLDIIGPLPGTKADNKHVLVVVDYFTKWVEAFPLPEQKAETVARTLMRDIVSIYGVPVVIHRDQRANFEGNVMKQLRQLLVMKKTGITTYHPQSDGVVERMNKTLMEAISKYVFSFQQPA